jgi:hypothetical protein
MSFSPDIGRFLLRAIAPAVILVAGAAPALGADTYSAGALTIPSLAIGNATYSDVVVNISGLVGGPAGTGPVGSVDTYDPLTGLLSVQAVTAGPATAYNVQANVASLVSIGSASGVDTYAGGHLTIPYVQVNGGAIYRNVVVTVGKIGTIGSGLPAYPWDTYSTTSQQLNVAAVSFGGKIYTNVTATVAGVVSVGGGAGTAQTITFPTPGFSNDPYLQIGAWAGLSATASSGLPVTYVSTTPAVCGVYTTTAQEQYIAFQYFAPYPAPYTEQGVFVAGTVPGASGIYTANTAFGTATLVNGQATNLHMGLASELTPYPSTGQYYTPPYPNYTLDTGFFFDNVFILNGGAIFDQAGIALQVPGDLINLGNSNGFYYADLYEFNARANGLNAGFGIYLPGPGTAAAGMSAGACTIAAFQAGNGTYASAPPQQITFDVGEIILP